MLTYCSFHFVHFSGGKILWSKLRLYYVEVKPWLYILQWLHSCCICIHIEIVVMKSLYDIVKVKKSCFGQAAKWMAVGWKTGFQFPVGTLSYFCLPQCQDWLVAIQYISNSFIWSKGHSCIPPVAETMNVWSFMWAFLCASMWWSVGTSIFVQHTFLTGMSTFGIGPYCINQKKLIPVVFGRDILNLVS